MPLPPKQLPPWSAIDTVLLDLDGTLLDLAFDDYFWLERIPAEYAGAGGLSIEAARAALIPRFRACEGTLDWYCVDYWSRELGLDVPALHHQEGGRVAWLPGAREFLERLKAMGKRVVLLTNAHPKTLHIKDQRTGVTAYFDAVFSSHQCNAPKEDARFWPAVREAEGFDPRRSIFVDDSLPVLRAARNAGIRWIYAVRRPGNSNDEFLTVDSVRELVS
jgi:putative hydrolase of the HAD superfamily